MRTGRVLLHGRQYDVVELDSAVERLERPLFRFAVLVLDGQLGAGYRVIPASRRIRLAGVLEILRRDSGGGQSLQHSTVAEEPPIHLGEAAHVVESKVKVVQGRRRGREGSEQQKNQDQAFSHCKSLWLFPRESANPGCADVA